MYKNDFFEINGGKVCTFLWEAENPVAVLQICHGMCEHLSRYDRFATMLNAENIAVFGIDYPGHGESDGIRGFFSENDGWQTLVSANLRCSEIFGEKFGNLPKVLMGHSMGSFVARDIAADYPETAKNYIFMGTAGKNPAIPIAKKLAKMRKKSGFAKKPDNFLNGLCFGAYAKAIKNAKTTFDWLSTDENEVKKYIDDENCGFPFTACGFEALFFGLSKISGKKWAEKLDKNKKYLLLSGKDDPVGDMSKGVIEVFDNMKQSGISSVDMKLYDGCRHELLNDFSKDDVTKEIIKFIKETAEK